MTRNNVTTDVQQICQWLGLPPNCWPPDHYTLLGLPPGEPNVERIEHEVHERLTRVRSYQLSHSALATEAMMHLAKAFDCLTDPQRKKAYDTLRFPQLRPAPPIVPSARVPTTIAHDTVETEPISGNLAAPTDPRLQWQPGAAPPPVRSGTDSTTMPALAPAPAMVEAAAQPPPVRLQLAQETIPIPSPVDLVPVAQPAPAVMPLETAAPMDAGKERPLFLSPGALSHLGTRRHLFERLWWTRRVMRAWSRAGKYLNKPKRNPAKRAEEAELTRMLFAIDDLLQESPGLLGQPGQPGYRILALASLEPVAEQFKALDEEDRVALTKDWNAGREVIEEYRGLLMEQVKSHRRLTRWQRFHRATSAMIALYWVWILVVLAFLNGLVFVIFW